MTPLAVVFMALSWSAVLGLTVWAYTKVLGAQERRTGEEDGREQSERG